MPEPSHRRREIAWQDVIRHHKEITRRAEETFFSLPVGHTDSERWTSLTGILLDNFAGEWKIPIKSIKSSGMLRSIRGDTATEYFLGCACWLTWKLVDKNWEIDGWRPSIYRQVEVIEENSEIIIKPIQGKWEFSPLVFSLLDTRSFQPPLELNEWLPQLLESAQINHDSSKIELSSAFVEVLSRDIPPLAEVLKKPFPKDKNNVRPTQWILFKPPASTTAVNQHLMADYNRISTRLENDTSDIGGFRLFEDIQAAPSQDLDLLPIVALNESQRKAVSNILQGNPVTVISGPPGCGKSQVVVSAMLNAWAKGITVIFASNTNPAVNVVKERIKRFEEDFPIAIRAGSNRESNLEEALRQALNVVRDVGRNKGSEESAKKQRTLSENRKALQQFFDSNIPQRIDQSLRSALSAHARYLETTNQLIEKEDAVRKSLSTMHYKMKAESFETELLIPLQEWLDEATDVRISLSSTEQERSRLEAEINNSKLMRNTACQKVGLDTQQISSWEWLISGPDPDIFRVWRDRLRETLNKPLENSLESFSWDDSYNRWNGSAEAKKWNAEACKLLSDVRAAVNRLSPLVMQIKEAHNKYRDQQRVMSDSGVPENITPDSNIITAWMALFAEHTTSLISKMDWLPWSAHQKRDRQLQQLEKQLRPLLPISIWQRIGAMNNEGRTSLGAILEKCQKWAEVQRQWHDKQAALHDVENTYFLLRSKAVSLGIASAPANSETDSWQGFEAELIQLISGVENAERSWKKKEDKENTISQLRKLVADFDALGSGIPLKEEWRKGRGIQLDTALKALADTPSSETLVATRTALYTTPLDDFLTNWDEARKNEEAIRKHSLELSRIPSNEALIEAWWRKHPKQLPAELVKYPRLPEPDDQIFNHVAICIAWQQSWEQHRDIEKPQLQKIINEEYSWAQDGLSKVGDSLPKDYSENARSLVRKVLADSKKEWPTDELLNVFSEFGPDAIKARIESIDQELEELAFTFARDEWIGKLSEDVELQDTLSKLLNNFSRKRGRIDESDYDLFRKALKAVPIWITTAQATQSIPLLPDLFDILIIDEATQCTVTNLLPLVYRAKHIAVIGDKEQLGAINVITPSVETALANSLGVEQWLDLLGHNNNTVYTAFIQCLPKRYSSVIALDEHYRSHPLIIGFANEHVYRKKLRLKKDPSTGGSLPCGSGVFLKNIVGLCQQDKSGHSWQNHKEATEVVSIVKELRTESHLARHSIGIVTPFAAQVKLIQDLLDKDDLLTNTLVGTAHKLQGDERDIIIFSPVVSKGIRDQSAAWVENPPNLINVAVTRAREALFIVGDVACCKKQPGILGKLAAYAEEVETLRETSREELELFSWMVIQGWAPKVHPMIGDIEVDFELRHEGRKLAIEVDGTQHDWSTAADNIRDASLKSRGYKVLRIPSRAVRETPSVCIERIESVLQSA